MKKYRVAVIGCGSIARHRHLLEYRVNPNVEIVAVCDIIPERVQETAEEYGAQAFTDYQELLEQIKPDLVSVCLPNYLHAPVSIAALKAGANILCEKPMATSYE